MEDLLAGLGRSLAEIARANLGLTHSSFACPELPLSWSIDVVSRIVAGHMPIQVERRPQGPTQNVTFSVVFLAHPMLGSHS